MSRQHILVQFLLLDQNTDSMADTAKTVVTELLAMGLQEEDMLVKYVKARRMTSLEVFRLAGNDGKVAADYITVRLSAGHKIGEVDYQIKDADEAKDMNVILQALHARAVDERKRLDNSLAMTPGAALAPAVSHHGPTAEDKKKIYDPTRLKQRVDAYEAIMINDEKRTFPIQQLLGADETLIRLEKESVSGMYYPITLGEILAQRLYTSYNTMNKNSSSLKKDNKGFAVQVGDRRAGQVTIFGQEPEEFTPNSSQLIQDGAVAAGWAMKLFQLADEPHIDQFIDWYIILIRKYPHKLWAVKEIWDTITWDIALAMRKGQKFATISVERMSDPELRFEILTGNPPKESPTKRTTRSEAWKEDKPPGKGAGKGKGGKKQKQGQDKIKKQGQGRGQKNKGQWQDNQKDNWNDNNDSWDKGQKNKGNWDNKWNNGREWKRNR